MIPYSPLAGGFLTGKYRPDETTESARLRSARRHFNERNWKLLDLLAQMGKDKGSRSTSQMALAWLLADPLVTSPIIGPRSIEQLKDNLGAADLQLTSEEKQALDAATQLLS